MISDLRDSISKSWLNFQLLKTEINLALEYYLSLNQNLCQTQNFPLGRNTTLYTHSTPSGLDRSNSHSTTDVTVAIGIKSLRHLSEIKSNLP